MIQVVCLSQLAKCFCYCKGSFTSLKLLWYDKCFNNNIAYNNFLHQQVYVGKAKILHEDICKHFECFDKKRDEICEIDDELCHHTDSSGWEIIVWPLQPDQNLEVEWAKKIVEHEALTSKEETGLNEDMEFSSATAFDKFWDWFSPNQIHSLSAYYFISDSIHNVLQFSTLVVGDGHFPTLLICTTFLIVTSTAVNSLFSTPCNFTRFLYYSLCVCVFIPYFLSEVIHRHCIVWYTHNYTKAVCGEINEHSNQMLRKALKPHRKMQAGRCTCLLGYG